MKIKQGVYGFMHIKLAVACAAAEVIWIKHGAEEAVITANMDGKHAPKSDHYEGRAIDLRIRNIDPLSHNSLLSEMKAALTPPEDWYLKLHKTHLHVSYRGRIEV